MTTSITNRSAPAWLRELARGRATYEELLGWPVSVRVGERVLTVAVGHTIDAVRMPARLGALVRAELCIALLLGPVMADPDGGYWTFFTKPIDRLRPNIAADLSDVHVLVVPHGHHVVVPTSPHVRSGTHWHWLEPPNPMRSLPPAYAVIGMTRRLTAQHRLAA
ncbi:bifunctional DNA primase/polymerase [Actinophytocola sp.]|uniref:bifunctional DNA primase/polymerase n=1 Tax=Actinophytocola sp. TaxID=1872138 RepID=UPI002ED5A7E6